MAERQCLFCYCWFGYYGPYMLSAMCMYWFAAMYSTQFLQHTPRTLGIWKEPSLLTVWGKIDFPIHCYWTAWKTERPHLDCKISNSIITIHQLTLMECQTYIVFYTTSSVSFILSKFISNCHFHHVNVIFLWGIKFFNKTKFIFIKNVFLKIYYNKLLFQPSGASLKLCQPQLFLWLILWQYLNVWSHLEVTFKFSMPSLFTKRFDNEIDALSVIKLNKILDKNTKTTGYPRKSCFLAHKY